MNIKICLAIFSILLSGATFSSNELVPKNCFQEAKKFLRKVEAKARRKTIERDLRTQSIRDIDQETRSHIARSQRNKSAVITRNEDLLDSGQLYHFTDEYYPSQNGSSTSDVLIRTEHRPATFIEAEGSPTFREAKSQTTVYERCSSQAQGCIELAERDGYWKAMTRKESSVQIGGNLDNLTLSESRTMAHTTTIPASVPENRWLRPTDPNPARFLDESVELATNVEGLHMRAHFDKANNELILYYPKAVGPKGADNLGVYSSRKVDWHEFANMSREDALRFCAQYFNVVNPLHFCGKTFAPPGSSVDEVGILNWHPGEQVPSSSREGIGATTVSPSRKYAWRHRKKHFVREEKISITDGSGRWSNGKDSGPAPYNPEIHLENSILAKEDKPLGRRLGYDPVNQEILIFDWDSSYLEGAVEIPNYHGHARPLNKDANLSGEHLKRFCAKFKRYFTNCSQKFVPKSKEKLIEEGVLTQRQWDRMDEVHGLRYQEKPPRDN